MLYAFYQWHTAQSLHKNSPIVEQTKFSNTNILCSIINTTNKTNIVSDKFINLQKINVLTISLFFSKVILQKFKITKVALWRCSLFRHKGTLHIVLNAIVDNCSRLLSFHRYCHLNAIVKHVCVCVTVIETISFFPSEFHISEYTRWNWSVVFSLWIYDK